MEVNVVMLYNMMKLVINVVKQEPLLLTHNVVKIHKYGVTVINVVTKYFPKINQLVVNQIEFYQMERALAVWTHNRNQLIMLLYVVT